MVADMIASVPELLHNAQTHAFSWGGWIVAGSAGSALVGDIALSWLRHRDSRVDYLARFLDVPAGTIVPLPPATALWALYAQRNRDADPDAELPPGATTLSGSYLVLLPRGAALVCVHNMETASIGEDQDVSDLAVGVDGMLSVDNGLILPEGFPIMLEEDAVKRADLVEYILKARFRYGGSVQPLVLLKDGEGLAGPQEDEVTLAGLSAQRINFDDPLGARAVLADVQGGSVPDAAAVKSWIEHWAGRVTSLRRRAWRVILLALGVSVGLAGGAASLMEVLPLS